ncbi:MAG: methyltransferase [Thermodesulfobacteriota bacterium]
MEPNPVDKLLRMATGFQQSRVLLTAMELDIFGRLDKGPAGSEKVARALGCDPRATDRLLCALTALGLCSKKGETYENTPEASRFLVAGKPDFMAGLFHANHLYHTWGTLTEAVRSGTSVSMGPVNDRGEQWLTSFIAAMHWRASRHAPLIADMVDIPGNGRVLDVGGGSGAYSAAFVRKRGNATAVVFDLPNVVDITRGYLVRMGVEDSVEVVSGDYLKDDLPKGFSAVWLSAIIHSNSVPQNISLFEKCREALVPGGKLIVQDFIMDPGRTSPAFGALFALNMLVNTECGDTFTRSEVESWMERAGLSPEGAAATPFGTTLLTAAKP